MTTAARRFPRLAEDELLARLEPPRPGSRPAVVVDTDAANEIDDPFAIAWALLAADRLRIEACFAAPFSFEHRRHEALRARVARDTPALASEEDHELLRLHAGKLAFWEQRGWDIATLELPSFCTPEQGMRRSEQEIRRVYGLLGLEAEGRVFAGSTRYLAGSGAAVTAPHDRPRALELRDIPGAVVAPERSPAVKRLVELAAAQPRDEPLVVLAIGCLTNIANALLLEPELVRRIVVVWTAGYPTHAPHVNRAFNLEQDVLASQLVFDCGVPLVYLPGYHVGAQLRLSLPEMEASVRSRGAIGAHLYELFTHNPLWPLVGIGGLRDSPAYSWVIWDLIDVAWLLEPAWVPSELVRAPRLGADLRWHRTAADETSRHWMREAHAVQRDAIFGDFFACLARAR